MKKIMIILLLITTVMLTGCVGLVGMSPDGPETVELNNQTYKTGFYGTMFPNCMKYADEICEIDDVEYKKVEHENFDLYHAQNGEYLEGTVYCNEEQYEEASTYYSDGKNYLYYCMIDNDKNEIDDVDTEMFNALLNFADNSEYMPFDEDHNEKVEKIEMPMPDENTHKKLIFYKESKDFLFTSSKGHEFYIIDNSLYFVYQYVHDEECDKLIAVGVPSEISEYFVDYMKKYL